MKLKDNVGYKQLVKYGFQDDDINYWYGLLAIFQKDRHIYIFESNSISCRFDEMDKLTEMIKDGLVEL